MKHANCKEYLKKQNKNEMKLMKILYQIVAIQSKEKKRKTNQLILIMITKMKKNNNNGMS